MARLVVKVCGITTAEDAQMAVRAGADALGFVFWSGSPRVVDAERVRAITADLPPFVLRVGVFVDAGRDQLCRTADRAGLDLLQLHGSEPPEALLDLNRRVIKALRVGPGFAPEQARRYQGRAAGLLLDTLTTDAPGGTGRPFDWSLARAVRTAGGFLMLAGGLNAGNVAAAIEAVGPDGVDVSSGVEASPGRKDEAKVRAFLEAVRSMERQHV
jgi:phosphoribosylanthranilate isomerase